MSPPSPPPTVRRTRFVRASPEQALALLRDFSRLPDYNPRVRRVRTKPGPLEPGDTFRLWVGPLPARGRVVSVDGRSVRVHIRSIVDADETRFADPAPGGCTVGWEVRFSVPPWLGGRAAEAWVFRRLAEVNIERELDGVQRILEAAR